MPQSWLGPSLGGFRCLVGKNPSINSGPLGFMTINKIPCVFGGGEIYGNIEINNQRCWKMSLRDDEFYFPFFGAKTVYLQRKCLLLISEPKWWLKRHLSKAPQAWYFLSPGRWWFQVFWDASNLFFFHPSATNLVMKPKIMGEHAFAKGRLWIIRRHPIHGHLGYPQPTG